MNNINIENKVTVNTTANTNGINTIPEEFQALGFIQGLLCRQVDPKRIVMRDARSYCALLIDDNNRKTLCRLFLENSKKKIELPKINKTIEIKDLFDLKKAKSALFEVLNLISKEELIAEMGAAFLCAESGIYNRMEQERSADYIKSWCSRFREKPALLWQSASKAQRAVDFILGTKFEGKEKQ